MDTKRSDMERFRMVGIDDLQLTANIKHPHTAMVQEKIDAFIVKYGQFQFVVVSGLKVVHGNSIVRTLKRLGKTAVLCFDLGELSDVEFKACRMLLIQSSFHKPDHIGIAEMIADSNEGDLTRISNKTGISLKNIERYHKLLQFDWEQFNGQEINPNQLELF